MKKDTKKKSIKKKVADHFLSNIGKVVTTAELRDLCHPQVAFQRRIRELREEGWPIESHLDNANLKPGEYVLTGEPPEKPTKSERRISNRVRAQVLERDGNTCQACGIGADEEYPDTGRKALLQVGHIQDRAHYGGDDISNLRTLCARCNEGGKHLTQEPPTWSWIFAQVRRTRRDHQKKLRAWLNDKFKDIDS